MSLISAKCFDVYIFTVLSISLYMYNCYGDGIIKIFSKSYNPIIYIVLYTSDNNPYTIYVHFVSVITESNTYEHIKQSMVLQLVSQLYLAKVLSCIIF